MQLRFAAPTEAALPIWLVTKANWPEISSTLPKEGAEFARASGFEPKAGQLQLLPTRDGGLFGALFGVDDPVAPQRDRFAVGALAKRLPPGRYRFATPPDEPDLSALAFLLGTYSFDAFRDARRTVAELAPPPGVDAARIERIAEAVAFGRDLINFPANVMTPMALEARATALAEAHGAEIRVVRADDLIAENLPLIHAVGDAAAEAPRLVDFVAGARAAPKVTIVGKGVTFDTGGLDIKPASGMELMKKDMAGAATALTLARMLLESGTNVRLRVLLPIVENAISARAMRPSDIVSSRKGLKVEIANTDAEGRLILADALALADEEAPDLLLDFATLTGAARVALGPDLPPFYTDSDRAAADIERAARKANDPLWRMPLWRGYDGMLESKTADLSNSPSSPFAGSITAALFLRRFVEKAKEWAHVDIYGWNPKPRAHGPEGGEPQGARAFFDLIDERYGR